jgi:hypothetical protein
VPFREFVARLKKAATPPDIYNMNAKDEEEKLSPSLANLVSLFLQGVVAWSKSAEYSEEDAWVLTGIAMINTIEFKRLTKSFRKGNAFNAYEHYMHRAGKVPEEHKGREESAKWLAEQWTEMPTDDKAKFDRVKEHLGKGADGDMQAHKTASKKIMRRLGWTISFAEAMGLSAFVYVADTRWSGGTRVFNTRHGASYVSILDYIGLGIDTFADFIAGQASYNRIHKILKPFQVETQNARSAGTTIGEPLIEGVMSRFRRSDITAGEEEVDTGHVTEDVIRKTFNRPRQGTKRVCRPGVEQMHRELS